MSRLERFRAHKNTFFETHEHSPLTEDQKERFRQLEYFQEDESLRFEVELDKQETSDEPITLGTTIGEAKEFVPAGKAHIEVDGHEVSLTVYREPGRGRYFLPFRDATAGHETYDVGRYLDPSPQPAARSSSISTWRTTPTARTTTSSLAPYPRPRTLSAFRSELVKRNTPTKPETCTCPDGIRKAIRARMAYYAGMNTYDTHLREVQ